MNDALKGFKEYLSGMKAMKLKFVELSKNSQQTWDRDPNLQYNEGGLDILTSVLVVFSSFFEEEGRIHDEDK